MVDTLSIVLMAAALAGGVLRAYINGSLAQKQTIGDIIITGAAGGSFPMLGVIPKDLTLFHAGLMMFGVAYVASDALQRIYTGMVDRFAGPLIPPAPKTVFLLPAVLLLGGCALAGAYPGYITADCLGDGLTVSGSGQTTLMAGVGGAGQNSFTITCKGKGTLIQGKEPPPAAAK